MNEVLAKHRAKIESILATVGLDAQSVLLDDTASGKLVTSARQILATLYHRNLNMSSTDVAKMFGIGADKRSSISKRCKAYDAKMNDANNQQFHNMAKVMGNEFDYQYFYVADKSDKAEHAYKYLIAYSNYNNEIFRIEHSTNSRIGSIGSLASIEDQLRDEFDDMTITILMVLPIN